MSFHGKQPADHDQLRNGLVDERRDRAGNGLEQCRIRRRRCQFEPGRHIARDTAGLLDHARDKRRPAGRPTRQSRDWGIDIARSFERIQ